MEDPAARQHGGVIFKIFLRHADRLALVCLLAISYLSLTPLPEPLVLAGSDKLQHLIAYSALAFLAVVSRKTTKATVIMLIAVIVYGGLIELIQPYVNRSGDFIDFLANIGGAILGGLLARSVGRLIR